MALTTRHQKNTKNTPPKNILWEASDLQKKQSQIQKFIDLLANKKSLPHNADYPLLWQFSIDNSEIFWSTLWDFCGIIGDKGPAPYIDSSPDITKTRFFPKAQLNFAENLLRTKNDKPAIIFWGEDKVKITLSFKTLYDQVSLWIQALQHLGIKKGDVIAAIMPNHPTTIIAMLAATSLGAVWSSCSPDFGSEAIYDRFDQLKPCFILSCDYYFYQGKTFDCLPKAKDILKKISTAQHLLIAPYDGSPTHLYNPITEHNKIDFLENYKPQPIFFKKFPFDHPLFIMFSSGTTGKPKAIMHRAGGVLLQHLKEHQLHCDIKADDRVFYFTTCGWMMWNWLVSALATEATLLLYDGSPFYPHPSIFFDFADQEKMTFFGTSAKYIDALEKQKIHPQDTHKLTSLKTMTSTGSPLRDESFTFVYEHIKSNLHLASISGGTDILSCFVLGCPLLPVYKGQIQTAGLGMDIKILNENAENIVREKGELTCQNAFPSMPIKFINDPKNKKYHASYFEKFPNIWCHGDYIERTAENGFIIFGRSDTTLNPNGVRIGTAEIYRQVENLDYIVESLVVGQQWNHDERIILFIKLREGIDLDQHIIQDIKRHIRHNTTPRHVPAKIIEVTDIPKTKNGKITERAVKQIIAGEAITNKDALANPEALELYKNIPELYQE